MENGEVKLLSDMNIQFKNLVEARRPDIIVVAGTRRRTNVSSWTVLFLEIVEYMRRNLKKLKNIRICREKLKESRV